MGKPVEDRAARFLRHLEPLQAALEAYCRRSVRDASAVEDVLQEAVGKAFRDFHLYAEGTNFKAWIFRYLNLEIYAGNRAFRRHQHEPMPLESAVEDGGSGGADDLSMERLLEEPEMILAHCDDALAAAVAGLNEIERASLLLRITGPFKHREIADILGVPVGTVLSALSRGRLRLRHRLAGYARDRGLFGRGPVRSPR